MAGRHLTFSFPTRTLILAVGEVGLLISSFLLATLLQFRGQSFDVLAYQNGLYKIVAVAVLGLLCMYYLDLYNTQKILGRGQMQFRVLVVIGTLSLLLGLLGMLFPRFMVGNYVFLTGLPILASLVFVWRKVFFTMNSSKHFLKRTLILGDGDYSNSLWTEVESRPELGLKLVGYVSTDDHPTENNRLSRLGSLKDLSRIIEEQKICRIVVTMRDRRGKLPVEALLGLKTRGVTIEDAADFYEGVTGRVPLESLRLSWLLFSRGFCPSRLLLTFTRAVSAIAALLLLVISLPVLALISLAILLDTGRPILFRQKRVGKNGKLFTLYKFRSMRIQDQATEKARPAKEGDERFTRTGRWLRKSRMDELPQLYNVLRGDMSFVGPRPFMIEEEFDLAKQIPFYEQRWSVSPGVTGWAQVHRAYCVTLADNEEKLSYDLFYIKNLSIGLDLLVLFQTVKILLLGRGSR
jgi:sugar transferase (PEP-CTERM system associated)